MVDRSLQSKLSAGEIALGAFVKITDPCVTELMALAGFDFVILDMEHGSFSHAQVENAVRAAELFGVSTIVRVPDAQETNILHALDSGASGVQIPSLRSAQEAGACLRYAHYHPVGQRGFARASRAGRYGGVPLEAFLEDSRRTLVAVHVENTEMLDDIDALCAVPALDVVFVGAADLSQSMGFPGQSNHPRVQAALERVATAAHAGGKHLGALASSAAEVEALRQMGARYIVWQSDTAILRQALTDIAKTFRTAARSPAS